MDEEKLNTLAGTIARGNCVLFAGAGLSITSGGISWNTLIERAEDKFDYDSPLEDNFDILHDIVDKNDKKEVHQFVKKQVADISLDEPVASLAELPWFATFTTNYDTALEDALSNRQETRVRTVLDDAQFEISGAPTHLLCVKLMGSVDREPGQVGSMVLTRSDMAEAQDKRSRIFDMLSAHAANLSFLFIGYSFEDSLMMDILERINSQLGRPDNTYYALFKEEPNKEKRYRLEQLGVNIIIGDINDFSEQLMEKVSLRDPEDYRTQGIPIGNDVIQLPNEQIGDFLDSHDPLLIDDFEKDVPAKDFFRGNLRSFKPFIHDWYFERNQEDAIFDAIITDGAQILSISGPPGSGRTFLIHAVVQRLITEERAIGFRIPGHTMNPIPDTDTLKDFMEIINKRIQDIGIEGPEYLVFFADSSMSSEEITDFDRLQREFDIPMILLFESLDSYTLSANLNIESTLERFQINENIPSSRYDDFKNYLIEASKEHKLPEITEDEISFHLGQTTEFLPLMYTLMDPARRSIQEIVEEEYSYLPSDLSKELVILCSISTSLDIKTPVTVCRNYLSNLKDEILDWDEAFQLGNCEADAFITESQDSRTNPLFSIYHSVIAEYICKQIRQEQIDSALVELAKSVNLEAPVEAEFIGKLLITKGVNAKSKASLPFTQDGLEEALEILANQQPARPILHHLAQLKADRNKDPNQYVPILKEALTEPPGDYELNERKENVLVTLANRLWEIEKNSLDELDRNSPEVVDIFNYLESAREAGPNPHAYHVQARILRDLAEEKKGDERLALITEATDLLDEGLEMNLSFDDEQDLRNLKIELMNKIDRENAEKIAKESLEKKNDGSGYYTLAKIERFKEQNNRKALDYLYESLKGDEYPAEAIDLIIEICLENEYDNYDTLIALLKRLEQMNGGRETWKSALRKGMLYVIDGDYHKANEYFNKSHRMAPQNLQRSVAYFWMEGESRKIFEGTVGTPYSDGEGWIYNHRIDGWEDDIYFLPSAQDTNPDIRPGLNVMFELGFSPRGPWAFELELLQSPQY